MKVFLDTSEDLKVCQDELGVEVGQLLTPLTRFKLQNPSEKFAIDNGAYSSFNSDAFTALLKREWENRKNCVFVTAPDVVGSARRTWECFYSWYGKLANWPLAFVAQDGQGDLPIDWDRVKAVFIGGTDNFKMGNEARQIIKTAQILGKWVHVGRVNGASRFKYFEELGCDSCDGSGLARYTNMRLAIRNRHLDSEQNSLFESVNAEELPCT